MDTLLTIKQVCEILGISRTSVWRLVAEETLKPVRPLGGRGAVRFSRARLQAWMDRGCPRRRLRCRSD